MQGYVELQAGQEVVFGYVDLANARGVRNAITYIRLPVAASLADVTAKK